MLSNTKQDRTIKFAKWIESLNIRELGQPHIGIMIKHFSRVILEEELKNDGENLKIKESGLLET